MCSLIKFKICYWVHLNYVLLNDKNWVHQCNQCEELAWSPENTIPNIYFVSYISGLLPRQ